MRGGGSDLVGLAPSSALGVISRSHLGAQAVSRSQKSTFAGVAPSPFAYRTSAIPRDCRAAIDPCYDFLCPMCLHRDFQGVSEREVGPPPFSPLGSCSRSRSRSLSPTLTWRARASAAPSPPTALVDGPLPQDDEPCVDEDLMDALDDRAAAEEPAPRTPKRAQGSLHEGR